MTESGDEYTGRAQVGLFGWANWNVVFSTTSDVKGRDSNTFYSGDACCTTGRKERGSGKSRYRRVLGCRSRPG